MPNLYIVGQWWVVEDVQAGFLIATQDKESGRLVAGPFVTEAQANAVIDELYRG